MGKSDPEYGGVWLGMEGEKYFKSCNLNIWFILITVLGICAAFAYLLWGFVPAIAVYMPETEIKVWVYFHLRKRF